MRSTKLLKTQKSNSGFMALVSMLILSTVLVLLMLTTSTSTFLARFDVLNKENKIIAESLAESCIHQGLLELAENYDYDPRIDSSYQSGKGVPVAVGSNTCFIVSTTPEPPRNGNSTNITIVVFGSHQKSFSTFSIMARVLNPSMTQAPEEPNISIISWKEV